MKIKGCKLCGFPIEYRPNLYSDNGVCGACLNINIKKNIDFKSRQKWLTNYLTQAPKGKYECVVGVSGGKDSHMIVKRLIENHGVKNLLLITTYDECTRTKAGQHNLDNICKYFNVDHITYRYKPKKNIKEMLECFKKYLNPYMLAELRLGSFNSKVVEIANAFNVVNIFYGEDAAFEYGSTRELNIFHNESNDNTKFIFMGAIYPYGYIDSLNEAKKVGFKDLDDFGEWNRQGAIENFAQIDSITWFNIGVNL